MVMKKYWQLLTVSILIAIIVAGCGSKGPEDIVGELSKQLDALESYKAEATLSIHTAEEPQEFALEVWHQKPSYYRIALKNKERDITQIILRNDDGVFVLTPHLNKSFRFQSGWPEGQGQIYLYESLVKDILADTNRKFTTEGDYYVFDMVGDYQNKNMTQQRIWLTKDLEPVKVQGMDSDYNVLVEINFSSMEFNLAYEDDAFDMKRNMEGALFESIPTMISEEEEAGSIGTFYPSYLPPNVEQLDPEEVSIDQDDNPYVVLRYTGDYDFNIIQKRAEARMVNLPEGEIVDLGFTIGVMSETSLQWSYEGVDFILASGDLPREEKIAIAQSFVGQANK